MSDEELQISYSVKEVLSRIEGKLDGVVTALAGKADHVSIVHLNERADRIEARVTAIEHATEADSKHKTMKEQWRQWAIPTLLSLVSTVALILAVVHP